MELNLKKTMKSVTLKFNPMDLRFNYEACKEYLDLFVYDNKDILTYVKFAPDFNCITGYHFNGIVQSSSYSHLLSHYKMKGPLKDKKVFLHMADLKKENIHKWEMYMMKREVDFHTLRNSVMTLPYRE